jgi:hypothetical protein
MPFPATMNMDVLRRVLLLPEGLRRRILFMWRDIKDCCLEWEAEQEAMYHQEIAMEGAVIDDDWHDVYESTLHF